jgi:hypothetical protein
MGGCGKSQLSFEFTHNEILKEGRYNPSMVFFIDSTTLATLEESYALIAKAKGVGSSAKDAIAWLSNTQQPSFILMDNADNPKIDLRNYIPRSTNVHILITTRLQIAGRDYASNENAFIHLDALSLDEAEELLIKTARLGPNRREGVRVLVQVCFAFSNLNLKDGWLKIVCFFLTGTVLPCPRRRSSWSGN